MSKLGWLTPDDLPAHLRCALLTVPDHPDFYAMLKGALVPLFDYENFEESGAVTEEEAAQWWVDWDSGQDWLVSWNPYVIKLLRLYAAGLVAYWPLNEALGATRARDVSGHARHGVVTGATWEAAGIGDGQTAISFDASGDAINVYSDSLRDAFPGSAGTLSIWAKVSGAGIWTDGLAHVIARLRTASDSYVRIYKGTDGLLYFEHKAGATLLSASKSTTTMGLMHLLMTWDETADEMKAYFNAVQAGSTQTGLGVWAGLLSSGTALLGANLGSGSLGWSGMLAHAALFDHAKTESEIQDLAKTP